MAPQAVAIKDLNGDGRPDLVVSNAYQSANPDGSCSGPGELGVLLGNGDGTFQPAVTYNASGYSAGSLTIKDVNGDGKPDLVVSNSCQSLNPSGICNTPGVVGVLLGNGDGTFQRIQ